MRYNGNLGGRTSLLKPYKNICFSSWMLLLLVVVMVACLLFAACLLLPVAAAFVAALASFCHEKIHFLDRKIPWHRLKNGIMRYNNNLGGLTFLLKPYIKYMFQLLDATAIGGGGLACLVPAACSLLPATWCLLLYVVCCFVAV